MPFKSYADAGFTTELLPILPPDATISPRSPAIDNLMASRGKVPGKLANDGWFGFGGWTTHSSGEQDIQRWGRWCCGVGLQGRNYPAIDIDVDDAEVADAIEAEVSSTLGLGPTRFGRAGRRLRVYSGAGLRKRRLAFRLTRGTSAAAAGLVRPGEVVEPAERGHAALPEGVDTAAVVHAVEILGEGQQYVVEGVHPKTGKPYTWRDGFSPAQCGVAGLTVITAEQVDAFLEKVAWMVENLWDGEIVSAGGAGAEGGERGGVAQDGLRAPSLEAVRAALAAIPNESDYDEWIRIMAMVKGATEGLEV